MNKASTISKKSPDLKSQQYDLLRSEGLNHIEALSSDIWTDYNIHDPGITMLEVLCYAITDLGYRTGFSVEDLLAVDGNNYRAMHEQFITAINVLPARPVTVTDYRKLIADIPGINNAWLVRHDESLTVDLKDEKLVAKLPDGHHSKTISLNGICNIYIEPDYAVETLPAAQKKKKIQSLIDQATSVFHRNRNLGEDLHEVSVVPEHEVVVCAEIEIKPEADAKTVHADILFKIEQHLSPAITHYSLQQMLARKKADGTNRMPDEIFEGPRLKNGFMDTSDLEAATLRRVIYTSDLINLLMDVDGVIAVKKLVLNYCEDDREERSREWCLRIKPGHKPTLCREKSLMHFFKDVIPVATNNEEVNDLLRTKYEQLVAERRAVTTTDVDFPMGKFKGADDYTSVTHHFPQTYGIGDAGLPARASNERRGQANQLKAYLLFFDQVLANYLAQLSNVRQLFSSDDKIKQTYFSQVIQDVKKINALFTDYDNLQRKMDSVTETESTFLDRRNRFLDHLLARFNESFTEYVLQLFSLEGDAIKKEVLTDKARMLQNYRDIGYNRGGAFDYFNEKDENDSVNPVWDSVNVSGLEKRLAAVLGIKNYQRRSLKDGSAAGLHVVEHLLLRPEQEWITAPADSDPEFFMPVCVEENCEEDCGLDPYSFRITVVLPAHAPHFDDVNYRLFLDKVIRLETPAHILPKICWVEKADLGKFEDAYQKWLEIKISGKINSANGKKAVADFINILFTLRSTHPDGELSSTKLEEKQPDDPAVLGRTQLSNPKKK